MQLRKLVITGAVTLLVTSNIWASETEKVTLREAITRGLQRNNQIKAARYQSESATAAATAASLHYLPSINFEEAWMRSDLPVNTFMMKLNQGRFTNQDFDAAKLNNPSAAGDFRTAFTLDVPVIIPEAWAASKVARHGAEQQEAMSEQAKEQISFGIFRAYLEVMRAHAALNVADKALEEAKESRRQAAVRTAAGLGLKSDELRASTQQAAMEQQRISAENSLSISMMRLAVMSGAEPGDELDVSETPALKEPARTLQEFLATAGRERKDLDAAEKGKAVADAELMQARSKFLPTLGAFGSWQMNDRDAPFSRDHDAWTAGVALKWNLFDGFRHWHGAARSQAARAAAHEVLEHTRKEVTLQVHEAWLRRIEAKKRMDVAASSVAAAEEAVRLLSRRFENSLANMVDLLDAQTALNQARANLVESRTGLMMATGALYQAAGIFLKEIGQ